MQAKQDYLSQLFEESFTYSKNIFVIIDIPESLDEYFFIKFHNKFTENQNQSNMKFWHFSLIPVYLNACIFLSNQSDLRSFMEAQLLYQSSSFPISMNEFFPDYEIDFLKPNAQIDQILHNWNPKGVILYSNLIEFVGRNMRNVKLPYQTALGLWFVYNLCNTKPDFAEVQIAPILGSFILTSVLMNRTLNPNNFNLTND